MEFHFYFKNMQVSEALKEYARKRCEEIFVRQSKDPVKVHVTFAIEHQTCHTTVEMSAKSGFKAEAKVTGPNMYTLVDQAWQKIERQLHKHKAKLAVYDGSKIGFGRDASQLEEDSDKIDPEKEEIEYDENTRMFT